MSNKKLSLLFKSSLDNLTSINPSFDKGILGIAYHGKNRNGSFIDRETFESNINTMFNCPIVCNYSRDTNSIGQHDVEIVNDDNGLRMVNVTQPVGVIPESAEWWWEEREEDDGGTHEYLCVDALIWKRQEAYKKIKENGITGQSMEINVRSGKRDKKDGLFHITSFDFLAFCLLESADPCFESAGLNMFALDEFRSQYVDMMADFKREFAGITSSYTACNEAGDTNTEGGSGQLNIDKLLDKYELTNADVDFDLNGLSEKEVEEKFEELKGRKVEVSDSKFNGDTGKDNGTEAETSEEATDEVNASEATDEFALTGNQYRDGLMDELRKVKYINPKYPEWGEITRYYFADYDTANHEVYAYDDLEWKLFGFKYAENGDNFIIDFDHPKRKRCAYVDFDEGDPSATYDDGFSGLSQLFDERFTLMHTEIENLKQYRQEKMNEERGNLEKELFALFEDISGVEAFEDIKKNSSKFSIEELEEKCFAIRGRNAIAKFSAPGPSKSTRVPVEQTDDQSSEPYGGIFAKYGVSK